MTAPPRATPAFLAVGVMACAVEGWLAVMLFTRTWDVGVVVAGHLVFVALLAAWASRSSACRADLRLPLLLVVTTATFGPLGAVGTMLTAGMAYIYARSARPFEEWYAALFPQAGPADPLRAALSGDADRASVAPFADILAFGSVDQKRELISLVANEFRPAFALALRLALDDSDNAVRVLAASAITRIEHDFVTRSVALEEAVRAKPSDASRLRTLAVFHADYANAGIFDAERARQAHEGASRAYLDYLRLVPEDDAARAAIGALLLQDGQVEEAAAWMETSLADADARPLVLLPYMDALYRLGRFGEVRRLAAAHFAEMKSRDDVSLVAIEMMRLWVGSAA